MSKTYKVDGMTCGGCAASVTRAVQALNPGAQVSVNLEAGTVTVEGIEESALGSAIEDAGFDFGGWVQDAL